MSTPRPPITEMEFRMCTCNQVDGDKTCPVHSGVAAPLCPTCKHEQHESVCSQRTANGIFCFCGVAAPLEPTRLTAKDFYEREYDGDVGCILVQLFPHRIEEIWKFAEAYAAAVSKNLQEELQSLRARLAQAQKELSEIYRCIPLSVLREYIPNWPKSVERIGGKP